MFQISQRAYEIRDIWMGTELNIVLWLNADEFQELDTIFFNAAEWIPQTEVKSAFIC